MKRCHKIVLMVLILLTMLSLGYSQLLVKNSANGEILRAIQTGQIGIGTTVLGSDKLTIAGSEKVIGKLAVTDSTILATLRITGNSPGSGKVLTASDDKGNATWIAQRTLAYAKVYSTNAQGAQVIPPPLTDDAGELRVGFNMEEVDEPAPGCFDLVNDWFLVPRTGYYALSTCVSIFYTSHGGTNPGTSIYLAKIPKNTTTTVVLAKGSSQTPRPLNNQAEVSTVVKLNEGDKVFVMATKIHDYGFEIWNTGDIEDRPGSIFFAIKEL